MSNAPRPDGVERLDWQENKREVFDTIAARYDKEIDWDEFLMGMKLLRWWLMRKAKGDTLEVSAGTGRNLPFYPRSALRSLTVTDVSIPMLQQAQSKFSPLQATFHSSEPNTTDPKQPHPLPTRFVPASAASLPAPSASFDTVVQSFGLCSQADPVRALQEIQRVCKPDGTILLLEHGRSHYAWLDDLLDRTAMSHADKWGCWYNRDVADILNRSGLEVIEMGRWHFGTTWWVVAKPGKGVTTK
ncbi:S-adenosyl-L-methionine-dependent methyltransferase [Gonapodya prolifera JEL478]|uniref:S-adenosyl-L-methionine-dependent methyltransferase n=1 Tax=Gonapodya prolifera (strain JEL478) TaxID=1344416 RepID=A0A139A590_GONPJ|nr:S-adenosyl-L-methionine-dependent methyltransferase [Gonapodya prolifera JEL478]|eukprot:KXS11976.1 S-adenosyl-L-methionine-dependent methyltransferase [Gonapodya prolifera JEL478]